jgi:hypothetical protein
MSVVNPYASIEKRNVESALLHMLETEYGLIGGRRILLMLIEDVMGVMEEFYPLSERVGSGTLTWTCTADEGEKAQPGKRTEEYKSVTVQLPLITTEDLRDRTDHKTSERGKRQATAKERDKKRLARVVKAANEQGGLLTIAELSVMLNKSYQVISDYAREWQAETDELLPMKGYKMDQGSSPTHKKEIVRFYEQGLQPPDIAREASHSLKSVERYLKDYERVKLLLKRGMGIEDIISTTGRGRKVVLEYIEIIREYHPHLVGAAD